MDLPKIGYRTLVGLIAALLVACSNTKHLPANDALYLGANIKFDSTRVSHRKEKELKSNLRTLTRPKPNSKILGLRVKLLAYNLAGNPKKKGSPRSWLKNKFGEPPVLASDVDLGYNSKVLQSYLQNKGFFLAQVYGDTASKSKKSRAVYHIQTGRVYSIESVTWVWDSSELNKVIATDFSKTLLKKNNPFDLDVIKAERVRIDGDLKDSGYYFFTPDYLIIDADSNLNNERVNMYVKIKKGLPAEAQSAYRIKDIYLYANYSLRGNSSDTSKQRALVYDKFHLIDTAHLFRPSLFEEILRIHSGAKYSLKDQNVTLGRMINIGLFKFVKNRFEIARDLDSPMLNAYYYLTPLPKKAISGQIFGTTKSDDLVGTQLTLGWMNRNIFSGGEALSISGYGGFEVQYSSNVKGYDTYRAGLDNKLSLPRFIVPFFSVNTSGAFMPKTNFDIGYDYLRKIKLFTLNSFRGSFGYDWKESAKKEHQLNPIAIEYVLPSNVSKEYLDSGAINPTLLLAIQKQFILGSNYTFTFNQLLGKQPPNAFYFNGNLDLSGNIAGLLSGADAKRGKTVYLLGLDFAQYIRAETDFRYYYKSGTTIWANRVDLGFGYPYGNSTALPFIKQFFVGGTNDVRAFRSRSVGPGTYYNPNLTNLLPDQSGDIKLELNTELRVHLFSVVNGAIFVDAGNVWLYNADTARPGGQFTGQFLQQLAVGTGLGLRLDVSILLVRLDVAFPLRVPYLPEGQRWVINQIDFGSGSWRRQNLVFNLGIGYPF